MMLWSLFSARTKQKIQILSDVTKNLSLNRRTLLSSELDGKFGGTLLFYPGGWF